MLGKLSHVSDQSLACIFKREGSFMGESEVLYFMFARANGCRLSSEPFITFDKQQDLNLVYSLVYGELRESYSLALENLGIQRNWNIQSSGDFVRDADSGHLKHLINHAGFHYGIEIASETPIRLVVSK